VHNLTQKLFLIIAFQAIIQRSDLRNDLKRHFQIINVHLLADTQCLKRTFHLISTILPPNP